MLSWPPLQHQTVVKGSICHMERALYDSVKEENNPVGYGMNLMQVNIASEKWSSGAPLLDGRGNVIGILHGGLGGPFSYFVLLRRILPFLRKHGINPRKLSHLCSNFVYFCQVVNIIDNDLCIIFRCGVVICPCSFLSRGHATPTAIGGKLSTSSYCNPSFTLTCG